MRVSRDSVPLVSIVLFYLGLTLLMLVMKGVE